MWNAREKSEYFFRDILPEEYFTDEAVKRREEEMKNIRRTREVVREILEQFPETRDSDNKLFIKVIEHIDGNLLHRPIEDVLKNSKEYGIPPFESVRRSRQKLQADNEHLRASKTVQEARAENEQEVRDFVSDCQWR